MIFIDVPVNFRSDLRIVLAYILGQFTSDMEFVKTSVAQAIKKERRRAVRDVFE